MRPIRCALAGLALIVGTGAACTRHHKEPAEPVATPEQQAAQERANAAQQAQQSARQFEKQRSDYQIKAEQQVNDLDSNVASLRAQAPTDPAAREQYMSVLSGVESQLASARDSVEELKTVSPSDWPVAQQRADQQIMAADAAYKAAAQHLGH